LERQVVLRKIYEIQSKETQLKTNIIYKMIPKKIFTKVCFESFERFFFLFSLKKKCLNLIFNIFENDLLDKEREILQINESINSNNVDQIDLENSKTFVTFLSNLLNTLIEFYLILQNIEIYLSNLNSEEFKESQNAGFWNNISASSLYIESLITLIREDNFSVKYQFESLRTICNTIKDEYLNFRHKLGAIVKKKIQAQMTSDEDYSGIFFNFFKFSNNFF